MPRKLTIFALVIIVLHIFSAAILGPSPAGTLIGNSLQIMACALAVAMTFAASRRGRGLTRPFWLLVGCGLAVWGVANLGWMYYELALHREPPTGSVVRFLFGTQSIFFAMALFLDQDKDSSTLDPESILDFITYRRTIWTITVRTYVRSVWRPGRIPRWWPWRFCKWCARARNTSESCMAGLRSTCWVTRSAPGLRITRRASR